MELWIRSQDKECLIKVNDIAIEQNMIIGYFDKETEYEYLGQYKSKERALEVLDEINEILQLKFCATLGTFEEVFKGYTEKQLRIVLKQMAVYEMPSE